MALAQSYVGTTSIGASSQTPATNTAYVKLVTVPADSVLTAVEGFLRLTNGDSPSFRVGVWADNAGAPASLLCLSPMPKGSAVITGATDRWWGGPVHMWFPSSTPVWIGIHVFSNSGTTLEYDSGTGSDRTIASGSVWTGETGALGVSVANSGHDYSIRGLVVT